MKSQLINAVLFGSIFSQIAWAGVLPTSSQQDALSYLSTFGYLPKSRGNDRVDYTFSLPTALLRFQEMARIPKTGVLDDETIEMMGKPRCGVTDKARRHRAKRYSHSGRKWDSELLTWRIVRFTNQLPQAVVLNVLTRAFQAWSDVTNIYFQYTPDSSADIEVMFAYGEHCDGYNFDGRGGVLAHAFFPPNTRDDSFEYHIAGDLHFDEGEPWTVSLPSDGQDLLTVAIHEIGHSLGLQHSNVVGSIMWPWSGINSQSFKPAKLAYDDILAIQLLYGGKSKRSLPDSSVHYLCQQTTDAILKAVDGKIYLFSGFTVTELNSDTLTPVSTPKPISSIFKSFPPNKKVDASVTWKGSWTVAKSYLFSGSDYYRFSYGGDTGIIADSGYPKTITAGWSMSESNFDAIFTYDNNNILYFVKGDQYWMHTGTTYGSYPGYPKPLVAHSVFQSLTGIQAGFLLPNKTNILFHNNHAYAYDHSMESGYLRTIC